MIIACSKYVPPPLARWLLSQGQSDRAIGIIRKFAKINKKEIDEKLFQQLKVSKQNRFWPTCGYHIHKSR